MTGFSFHLLAMFLLVLAYALVATVTVTISSYAQRRLCAYDRVRRAHELRLAYLRSTQRLDDDA